MGFKLLGNSSGNVAEVDATNQLKISPTLDPTTAGYVKLADSTGTPIVTDAGGRWAIELDNLLFADQVDGAAVNMTLWTTSVSTMTIAQASGVISLNSGNSTAANAYAILQSTKSFWIIPNYGPVGMFGASVSNLPATNATAEIGFGTVSGTAAPTDGLFFRFRGATSDMVAVISYGGFETVSDPIALPTPGEHTSYVIAITEYGVLFFKNPGVPAAVLPWPANQPFPSSTARLPLFARVYNAGTSPGAAPRIDIGRAFVTQPSLFQNRRTGELAAILGRSAYQSPATPFAQIQNHANSTSPTSATLSNTAAGYTTLGGRFQFAAVAGAATDYALFAYQVPAGYQLLIEEVRIDSVVTGAAIATTATILDWSIGVNSSAVSLATVDGTGTWAPRRIPLGVQGYALVAPDGPAQIGSSAEVIRQSFNTPLLVDGGRYCHIILQIPVGTATASQIFRGVVLVHGYFE